MRLGEETKGRLPAAVERAGYDRAAQRVGIVHLGIGAFHRAHQAVYTDAAMSGGDRDWAITGVSLRSPQVRDQLVPQDGLYTVTERGRDGDATRLIESVRSVIVAPEAPAAVRTALSAADTRVVTITVTEKGYHLGADGRVDLAAATRAGGTIYHHLARAVADRRAGGLPGLSIVVCDNLPHNGRVLHDALGAFIDQAEPGARDWFERECACVSTMVDRIVPATTAGDLDRVDARLGVRDEGAVVTEPFSQWVIEDRFAGARPRWEMAGATLVADVAPYEAAKLRMLNGAHSALAYLGLPAGHEFVHQAINDAAIRATVERLMRQEAAASLTPAPGQDLDGYADLLLARFDNPALPHRLAQIATDGSQKIGPRWLDALRDNRGRGVDAPATLAALAAWMLHARGDARAVDDPRAAELATAWSTAGCGGIVDALFGARGLMPDRWQPTDTERATLERELDRLDHSDTTSAS